MRMYFWKWLYIKIGVLCTVFVCGKLLSLYIVTVYIGICNCPVVMYCMNDCSLPFRCSYLMFFVAWHHIAAHTPYEQFLQNFFLFWRPAAAQKLVIWLSEKNALSDLGEAATAPITLGYVHMLVLEF